MRCAKAISYRAGDHRHYEFCLCCIRYGTLRSYLEQPFGKGRFIVEIIECLMNTEQFLACV